MRQMNRLTRSTIGCALMLLFTTFYGVCGYHFKTIRDFSDMKNYYYGEVVLFYLTFMIDLIMNLISSIYHK